MTKLEKIQYLIKKGFTADLTTGKVCNKFGKEIISTNSVGYRIICFRHNDKINKLYHHHFVWYLATGELVEKPFVIDHINRNSLDNSFINLRKITTQQNLHNTDAKGYSYHKNTKKWQATISVNYKSKCLGYFNTEAEAREAYLQAKKIHHKI
jgi:hypothetical protein